MMGLALKNVTLTLFEDSKAIFDEQGEMLFTHFGISGPLTLSASSHLGDMKKHTYHAEIDLKPALSEEQLYDRITRDFALLANHAAQGALVQLLPSSMQPVMVARWGIDPDVYKRQALQYHLGGFGVVFIAATLALFSFSTFLGVLYYARGNVAYLCGDNWWSQTVYKLIALAMLVIGGMQAYTVVWDLGDVGIGLMTIFNMIALVPMAKEALAALNDYEKRKKLQ